MFKNGLLICSTLTTFFYPDELHTTGDPEGLLRLLKLARDVGGVTADGRWAQTYSLDRGLLKAGIYGLGMLQENWSGFVLWRTQDSGVFNLEHWLSEQLYGEWDYERACKELRDYDRSEPLTKLYQELPPTPTRSPTRHPLPRP